MKGTELVLPVLAAAVWMGLWRKRVWDRRIWLVFLAGVILVSALSVQEFLRGRASPIEAVEKAAAEQSPLTLEAQTEDGEQYAVPFGLTKGSYSEKEADALLSDACRELDQEILGDNESLDAVCYDLQLPTTVGEDAIAIAWSSDHPEYLRYDGQLQAGIPEEGAAVELTGRLTLEQFQEEYHRTIQLYPSREARTLQEVVLREAEAQVADGKEMLTLPSTYHGEQLSWYELHEQRAGLLCVLLIVVMALSVRAEQKRVEEEKLRRQELLQRQYPELVSKLQLYTAAGLGLRKCIARLATDYPELARCHYEMESGVGSQDAYLHFGERCGTPEYKKLALLLIQSEKRGGQQLSLQLDEEVQNAFENRKRNAKVAGDKATIRMVLPMGMMLLVVLVLIMVPAMMSF